MVFCFLLSGGVGAETMPCSPSPLQNQVQCLALIHLPNAHQWPVHPMSSCSLFQFLVCKAKRLPYFYHRTFWRARQNDEPFSGVQKWWEAVRRCWMFRVRPSARAVSEASPWHPLGAFPFPPFRDTCVLSDQCCLVRGKAEGDRLSSRSCQGNGRPRGAHLNLSTSQRLPPAHFLFD